MDARLKTTWCFPAGRLIAMTFVFIAVGGCVTLTNPAMPAACNDLTDLFLVSDGLADPNHACFPWLDATHGRVARSSSASAVIWSLRTDAGPGLLVSAVHTLGHGWFDPTNGPVAEALIDPAEQSGVPRIFPTDATGVAAEEATPLFVFFNPMIPDEENTNGFRDLLPVHDFYFGAVDDQGVSVSGPVGAVDVLHDAPPNIYDPQALASTAPTFTTADAGELVLVMGFPSAAPYRSRQTACVGRVLSDSQATAAIDALADVGDVEGDIPYDADVELLIMGFAGGGMSGGGVFDEDGVLVGIIVRASDPLGGVQYVRAVRMSYAVEQLRAAYMALPDGERAALTAYLGQELP